MSVRTRNDGPWDTDGHLPDLTTAHDVRHLGKCFGCDDLGDKRRMIYGDWHGRCYIKTYGLSDFLLLEDDETNKLSLGDIGMDAMKGLIDSRAKAKSAP